ncbi:MAG: L-aspartate oxidase [Oscillospiraceae bacterium]|nr:L-aspartate oxidase [Oscillospiraceae bacterium]
MEIFQTDVLIIGNGIAGLYTALHLSPALKVLFITKEETKISNSSWIAQGGIAAAVSKKDTPELHFEDTLSAGGGLCNPEAVKVLVTEGPGEIGRLVDMRVPFDLDEDGDLAMTREGGHTLNRVVHAGGDATGRETVKVLTAIAGKSDNISFWDHSFFVKLILHEGRIIGALILKKGQMVSVFANSVVLATGGVGQVFEHTTNPEVATGDGIAAAAAIGAKLADMEFVQFHPTAFYSSKKPGRAFLISEAVRGEGALLVSKSGEPFMRGKHPMGELAPRDVVSREIIAELSSSGEKCVYLDTSGIPTKHLLFRFPTIAEKCSRMGCDITRDRIPVVPAQHYLVGGVQADLFAETTVPGLFAVGETSCTGAHGANRLASNSLLECLVFGRRAALRINEQACTKAKPTPYIEENLTLKPSSISCKSLRGKIRRICWQYAGVIRSKAGLEKGLASLIPIFDTLDKYNGIASPELLETRNMAEIARAILTAALNRKESCGTHYRID